MTATSRVTKTSMIIGYGLWALFICAMLINEWIKITNGKTINKKTPTVSKIEFFLSVKYIGIISLFKEFQSV
jgi:hypothetical protein